MANYRDKILPSLKSRSLQAAEDEAELRLGEKNTRAVKAEQQYKKDRANIRTSDTPLRMGSMKNVDAGTGRGTSTPEKGTGAYTPKTTPKAPPKSDTSSTPAASGRSRENTSPSGGSSANIDTERYKPKDEPKMGSSENVDTGRIGKGGFEADEDYTPTPEDYTPTPKNQPVKFEDESSTPFWSRFKKGGKVKSSSKPSKSYAGGGSVSSASKRADGCAQRGKTKGKML